MASTNKTTNYNLSQFVGSDKPAWLSDYNQDMSKIDTQMKSNADAATAADGKADANTTSIGDLTNLNTTTKTNLVSATNEVNTNLGTVSGVATGANTTANTALTKATGLENALTFTQFTSVADNDIIVTGGNMTKNQIRVASNADGSIIKIYGRLEITGTNANGYTVTFPTYGRPDSNINIDGACLGCTVNLNDTYNGSPYPISFTISPNGQCSFTMSSNWYNKKGHFDFIACVLFMKDFGDPISS